ncbi:MAG: sigma 54-interacting transcriptional regulator, partial [Hyphomicrobiaceae bacterium]|nr:sigma 54-interacting transcriptional regulator [Hyphomicrobiaceae bacterium]
AVNCTALSESLLEAELFGAVRGAYTGAERDRPGLFRLAQGGTLLLDEVGDMSPGMQARLLRALQEGEIRRVGAEGPIRVDVRVITATNRDLVNEAQAGRFREDLLYRLRVLVIELPPLRERKEDMIAIAQAFLKKRCQAQNKVLKTLSSETIKLFQKYAWPGNVRELQNVLEQVVLLSDDDIIEPSSLPDDFLKNATGSSRRQLDSLEALARQMVESGGYSKANPLMPQLEALLAAKMAEHIQSKSKAASLLGITKPTLYTRLRGYDKMQ